MTKEQQNEAKGLVNEIYNPNYADSDIRAALINAESRILAAIILRDSLNENGIRGSINSLARAMERMGQK
jgi:hypothetical protein